MAYTNIKKSSDYFNTKLYTGDGTNPRAITGVGFQPDFTWIKRRSADAYHFLTDTVRGATKTIYSNRSDAEATQSLGLQSFDSDGFTVGSNADVNGNTQTFVGWNWLGANGTASNTDGSISSTVSANTTSGFSVCKLNVGNTTSTFGHGLNSVPKLIIAKSLSTGNWIVYHASNGANKFMKLNTTDAVITNANMWQNTTPTSSLVYISGSEIAPNEDVIFYCFAEKQGFSKFGSYVGNGSTDGTFIYTGFKPAFVIIKKTNGAGSWWVDDNKRDSFNPTLKALQANASAAEVADGAGDLDFLSNGFKCRDNTDAINISGGSYIYMAFAEEPLVGDNPATAR